MRENKRIAFWIKNLKKGINIDECVLGNPGIGGTQFEILYVATNLKLLYPEMEITLYSNIQEISSQILSVSIVQNYDDLFFRISGNSEILVFTNPDVDAEFYRLLEEKQIPCVAWIHNYLKYDEYKAIKNSMSIKNIVFVSQQLYDHYVDSAIIDRSTYIFNCITAPRLKREDDYCNKVVFTGAFIRQKGFHVLAKAWKGIVKECPDAQLFVLGGGLYGTSEEQKKYLEYCNSFLRGENGALLPSVHYMGTMGNEKEDLYKDTAVGVANPTGKTETFCLSAVEFEAHGIPVVTYNGLGLLDTVKNGRTGICVRSVGECRDAIIKLLRDKELNNKLGREASTFAIEHFSAKYIIPKWFDFFANEFGNKTPDVFSYKNYHDDLKWLRFLNSCCKKILGIKGGVSIQGIVTLTKYCIKKTILEIKRIKNEKTKKS